MASVRVRLKGPPRCHSHYPVPSLSRRCGEVGSWPALIGQPLTEWMGTRRGLNNVSDQLLSVPALSTSLPPALPSSISPPSSGLTLLCCATCSLFILKSLSSLRFKRLITYFFSQKIHLIGSNPLFFRFKVEFRTLFAAVLKPETHKVLLYHSLIWLMYWR